MNPILITGILLVVVSFLLREKMSVKLGFLFAFIIMAFQAGVEGDYMVYMQHFSNLHSGANIDWEIFEGEPVLLFLMNFFPFDSQFLFTFCLFLFEIVIVVRLVERYSPQEYRFLAAILFYFTINMMLFQMKGLRQGLAIELTILAFLLVDTTKWRKCSFVIIAVAFFTHRSMLVMLPFYILFYFAVTKPTFLINKESSKTKKDFIPILLVGVYLLLFFVKMKFLNQFLAPLILLTANEGNRFASYADSNNTIEGMSANLFEISPLIVLYDAIIIYLVASCLRKADPKMKVFCIISIVAAFGDMLFFGVGVFARIIMYMVIFNLVVYPAVLLDIRKKYGRVGTVVFIVFLLGYAVKTSLPWILETEGDRFGNYHFIFM